jgi:hypothetical protein
MVIAQQSHSDHMQSHMVIAQQSNGDQRQSVAISGHQWPSVAITWRSHMVIAQQSHGNHAQQSNGNHTATKWQPHSNHSRDVRNGTCANTHSNCH